MWLVLGVVIMLVIIVVYMLWLYKCVFFGEVVNVYVVELKDINGCEWLVLGVFVVGMFVLGLYFKLLIDLMEFLIVKLVM